MKRRHLFALRCATCGSTFILSRPRRILGWIPVDALVHRPGCDAGGRHLTTLHHRARLDVLRAGGQT